MSPHSYPPSQRAKLAFWRRFNDAVDLLRAPLRQSVVLLATGNASPAKVTEVDSRLRYLLDHLENRMEIRHVQRPSLPSYLSSAAVTTAEAGTLNSFALARLRWVADLDHETNPIDGWDLMDLGTAINRRPSRRTSAFAGRRTFVDRVQKLRANGPRPVYLFGTGPSLHLAGERSFADGATIVCNTIVRDPELWHHLAPAILTAGDAIYHFGHTAHARAFRADALRRLRESNGRTLFVYPAMFDVVVRSEFRDVQSLLVPIPFGEHTDITVDLTKRFSFPRIDNVLNALLLPLGCTLSNDVRLWGFDGRAPTDIGFWANSDRHAYPDLMQSIRNSHPAFFADKIPKGNEVQYVKEVHGDLLEKHLADAERRGFSFRMLHRSWTPTLQKRYRE